MRKYIVGILCKVLRTPRDYGVHAGYILPIFVAIHTAANPHGYQAGICDSHGWETRSSAVVRSSGLQRSIADRKSTNPGRSSS